MRMNVMTCPRCSALIHRGEEKKGCQRCGRISSTHGYEHAVATEREELIRIINRGLKAEAVVSILWTRAVA